MMMPQYKQDIIKFFQQHEGEYFTAETIPPILKLHFDVEMELPNFLAELTTRKIIKSDPKRNLSFTLREEGTSVGKPLIEQYKKQIETKDLELKMLRTNYENSKNILADYPKVIKQRNKANLIAIISAIIALASLLYAIFK